MDYEQGKKFQAPVREQCVEVKTSDISDELFGLIRQERINVLVNISEKFEDLYQLIGKNWNKTSGLNQKETAITVLSIIPRYKMAEPGESAPSYLICEYENKYYKKAWLCISIQDYKSFFMSNLDDSVKITYSKPVKLKGFVLETERVSDGLAGLIGQDSITFVNEYIGE